MTKTPLQNVGLLFLRISFGLMMLVHGWAKLMKFGDLQDTFPDPLGLGSSSLSLSLTVFAEVGCAILVILGILTRLSAIPLAITMAVAMFIVHGADAWDVKEKAALFLAAFITIIVAGPGTASLDHLLWNWWRKKKAKPTDTVTAMAK